MLLRLAESADAMAVARVHVRSWQVAYRGLVPDAYLDELRPQDRAARYDLANRDPLKPQTILAVDGAEILGFATVSPSRDPDLPDYGELCALYAAPEHWGRGVGATLIEAARRKLFEMGLQRTLLWMLVGNQRAARFYQIDGWRADGQRRPALTYSGIIGDEIRYLRTIAPQE